MNFDNFTPIEETNINSNIKSSNGITVFIPSGYFPILVRNNENVSSKDMIKELPRLNIKIPAFILNTTVNTSYNEKTLKKSPNAFMIFRSNICHVVKNKFSHLSNHQVSKLIGQLWSMLDPEVKKEYQQQAENLKKDQQKQNNGKYKYKKRSSNEITTGGSKKRKISDNEELVEKILTYITSNDEELLREQLEKILTQVSSTEESSSSNSTENNGELLTKLEKILPFLSKKNNVEKNNEESSEINGVKNTYYEESSESDNVQKTYFDENKQISFNYPQGFDQFFPSEYNILGLDSSNQIQFPLTSYGFNEWQSTDKLETPPSVSAYGEQSTGKLENSSELVDHSVHSVENVEKPNTLINEKQQSEKLVNLDYESLWSLIT